MNAKDCDERARKFANMANDEYDPRDGLIFSVLAIYWQREAERAEKREEVAKG